MEAERSLEYLPQEVVVHIASFLDVRSITACCATSSLMRRAFSDDLIWKRKCNLKLVHYLKENDCLVDPSFEWLEVMDDEMSSLPPVTDWRKSFMMQVRLFDNWRQGRYDKEQIEFGPNNIMYSNTKVLFFQNDYIFLHTELIRENRMQDEIWNVQEAHFLHSSLSLNFNEYLGYQEDINDGNINTYKIVDNKLIAAKFNLALVYDISLSSFSRIPLVHSFLFDKSEDDSKRIIARVKNNFVHDDLLEISPQVVTVVCRKFYIGIVTSVQSLISPILHIWDIETGKKRIEENIPAGGILISSINLLSSENEEDLVIKLVTSKHRYTYHYFGYDLRKLDFGPFKVKLNYCDFLILTSDCVVGAGPQQLFSYCYSTSEKLAVKKFNYQILKKTITMVKGQLLCGTVDSIIYIMDPRTLVSISSIKLGFTLYSLQAVCDKFVVVNSTNSELWEIGTTAKKLVKFPIDGSLAAINQLCTKLAIKKDNKIIILNFW